MYAFTDKKIHTWENFPTVEEQNLSLAKAVLVLDFLLSKVKVVAFTLNGYFPIYFQ